MKTRLLPQVLTFLLAAQAIPASAAVRQSGRGSTALAQLDASGTVRVESASGEVDTFTLPEGVSLTEIEEVEAGWIAAGGRRSGGEYGLYLVRGGPGGHPVMLPAPEKTGTHLQGRPVLLGDGRSLSGLAWLEGPGPLGVLAAAWTGDGWGPVEVVSPPSASPRDEQLALAGAVLDDGSWLLVWSAVDGNDDEIVWSRRTAAGWSAPVRLHEDNEVPDVGPALASLPGGGALAAWSWLDDGHYRLRTARFDGQGWSIGASFRGKGSLAPSLHRLETGVCLVYLTIAPESWSVVEFDSQGWPARTARLLDPPHSRPVLGESAGAELVLRFPALGGPGTASGRSTEEIPAARLTWDPVP